MSKKCEICGFEYKEHQYTCCPKCLNGVVNLNGTGEQTENDTGMYICTPTGIKEIKNSEQPEDEKIREAFEKSEGKNETLDIGYGGVYIDDDVEDRWLEWEKAYKSALTASEKEIEELRAEIENIKEWNVKIVQKKDQQIELYKSREANLLKQIEELKSCIDDVILQENQSLKEQIKILAHITYAYHPDVDMGTYINHLSTEDYQLFIENNKREDTEKDNQIEELKIERDKWETMALSYIDKYNKNKCCGNCGNEYNQESSAKCEYCIRYEDNGDEGREFQDNWEQKTPD